MSEQAKKRKSKAKTHLAESNGLSWIILCSIKGFGIGLLISVIMAFSLCGIAFMNADPDALLTPFAFAALYVPSFLAGVISIRKAGEQKLTCGLISGTFFMIAYMFVSLFFSENPFTPYPFIISLLLHILIVVFSVLGAFAGARKKRSPSHKRTR